MSADRLPVDDYGVPWEKVLAEIETAYRRGFHQGAALALKGIEDGHTPRAMRCWLDRVFRWRYRHRWPRGVLVKPVWPPMVPSPPQEKMKAGVSDA